MKKYFLTSFIAASALLMTMCGCTDPEDITAPSESSTMQEVMTTQAHEQSSYSEGTYSGDGFSLYADPKIWKFNGSQAEASCDLQMITDRDFVTCGISVYTDPDSHGGRSPQEIVDSADSESVVSTGSLATAATTFYYYEWEIDDNTHGRSYYSSIDSKYLCVYAESTNFGYVDGKIADLLSSIKLS